MSPLTFAMSTVTRNYAQTSSYSIPRQPFLETFMPLSYTSRTTHLWVTTSFLFLNSKHDFCWHLQQSISHLDNQPLQFCLSILETFIPRSKIYKITNYWQHAKWLFNPFIPVFLLTTTIRTKSFLSTQASLNF